MMFASYLSTYYCFSFCPIFPCRRVLTLWLFPWCYVLLVLEFLPFPTFLLLCLFPNSWYWLSIRQHSTCIFFISVSVFLINIVLGLRFLLFPTTHMELLNLCLFPSPRCSLPISFLYSTLSTFYVYFILPLIHCCYIVPVYVFQIIPTPSLTAGILHDHFTSLSLRLLCGWLFHYIVPLYSIILLHVFNLYPSLSLSHGLYRPFFLPPQQPRVCWRPGRCRQSPGVVLLTTRTGLAARHQLGTNYQAWKSGC